MITVKRFKKNFFFRVKQANRIARYFSIVERMQEVQKWHVKISD